MNAAERICYISFLRSKDESNFVWPAFLSQADRKLMRDRSRSLLVSESGNLMYQGKKELTISQCVEELGDLHPPETSVGHPRRVRDHASLLDQSGLRLPAFLEGNHATGAR